MVWQRKRYGFASPNRTSRKALQLNRLQTTPQKKSDLNIPYISSNAMNRFRSSIYPDYFPKKRLFLHRLSRWGAALICLLSLALPLQAQSTFPSSTGQKVKYETSIEMRKGYLSGICILLHDGQCVRGSLFNEFGVSTLDFEYTPGLKKVKLLNIAKMLDKWYIKRILRRDLAKVMECLETGKMSYQNDKYGINYQFTLLKDEVEE